MWHPDFTETRRDTAGLFRLFRRFISIEDEPPESLIHITANTRYKLYGNTWLVHFGPVKGDQSLWFYDEVDIAPYLVHGRNHIAVHVLRLFHATSYAPSFPHLRSGGLRISLPEGQTSAWVEGLASGSQWETAIGHGTLLRVDEPEDRFLHTYENTIRPRDMDFVWVPARILEFKNSTGNSPPWQLSPHIIPHCRV